MIAIGYIFLVAVLSIANAQNNDQIRPTDQRVLSRTLQRPERPVPIPYTLQLPRLQNPVPFYTPEISSDLRPPNNDYSVPAIFYEYPAPSQELQVPNLEPWNPNNDEIYYYTQEYPIAQDDVEKPTNNHPKKYNKDVHEKLKLTNSNPKDVLRTVDQDESEQQRKTLERFNKLENQKQIEAEKAKSAV